MLITCILHAHSHLLASDQRGSLSTCPSLPDHRAQTSCLFAPACSLHRETDSKTAAFSQILLLQLPAAANSFLDTNCPTLTFWVCKSVIFSESFRQQCVRLKLHIFFAKPVGLQVRMFLNEVVRLDRSVYKKEALESQGGSITEQRSAVPDTPNCSWEARS